MAHRRLYSVTTRRETVVDLLALDATNPRSMLFHLHEMREQAANLRHVGEGGDMSEFERHVLRADTALATHAPASLDTKALRAMAGDIGSLSTLLGQSYLH